MKRNKAKLKRVKAAVDLKSPRTSASRTRLRNKPVRRTSKLKTPKPRIMGRTAKDLQHSSKIVRIMGHGQLQVNWRTLKKLKQIDNTLVQIVRKERSDDSEFRRKLLELSEITTSNGKPVDPKEILRSDIIIPSPDLGLEEAKKLFRGDGVIPLI